MNFFYKLAPHQLPFPTPPLKMRTNRRTSRQKSNIFEMLTQQQIGELREAFNLFDTNNDTFITRSDLDTILPSIGNPFSVSELDAMMEEAGNISFMSFLTMIGEKLSMTDDEKVLRKALYEFNVNGKVYVKMLKEWLMNEGDVMEESEVDLFLKGCVNEDGVVNVDEVVSIVKHGEVLLADMNSK